LIVKFLAIIAKSITAHPCPPLVLRYIAPRRTGVVVVMDLLSGRFLGFVDRVKCGDLTHRSDVTPFVTTF
jgi:hypothetical protein